MVSENIVRDRTLVLRVLVPGLHTQLSDKLLAKQEGADSNSSTSNNNNNNPAATSSSSGNGGNNSGNSSSAADQILNLEGVTCLPSSAGSTLWHFRCDGATYPARLVNLPCPVEVHKTHDHATYHKSADIGQMLIVYEDEYAMEEAENEKGYKIEGFPSYYHSGLSPPMKRVVQRRFRARFEERESKAIPPPHKEVSEVEKGIQELITKLSAKPGKQKGRGRGGSSAAASSSTVTTKEKVIEEVEDEIVDYEPWMESGKIYTMNDVKFHPECWLTKDEMKEIETAKKAEEDEKQRKAEKDQEKKKRREEKKKKKQKEKQQAQAAAPESSSGGSKKKKGIPSLSSRMAVEEAVPVDDVDAAARMFINGEGNDEDIFMEMDEFNFDDEEDISALMM
eukprot:scaffold20605_cov110-Skeletonema_dohrnii-CCMP3373.AAC.8